MPVQELSKDVTRKEDTATPSKEADNKYEWVDVVKIRMRTKKTEFRVLPTDVLDLVADVPNVRIDRKTGIIGSLTS